jgi:fatty-acid desaturase
MSGGSPYRRSANPGTGYHHAFPTSARHGLKWWELDPSWFLILGMEKLGLVSNVVRIDPDRQGRRLKK